MQTTTRIYAVKMKEVKDDTFAVLEKNNPVEVAAADITHVRNWQDSEGANLVQYFNSVSTCYFPSGENA